jgi:hypothetical protein
MNVFAELCNVEYSIIQDRAVHRLGLHVDGDRWAVDADAIERERWPWRPGK